MSEPNGIIRHDFTYNQCIPLKPLDFSSQQSLPTDPEEAPLKTAVSSVRIYEVANLFEAVETTKSSGFSLSNIFSPLTGSSAGVAGCPGRQASEKCSDPAPRFDVDYMLAKPVYESDLQRGALVHWNHENWGVDSDGNIVSGNPVILNCNGTTKNLEVTCLFNGGENTFTPDENGFIRPYATFTEKLESDINCWLSAYYNPESGRTIRHSWEDVPGAYKFKLYPFDVLPDPDSECDPEVSALSFDTINLNERNQMLVGTQVPFFIRVTGYCGDPRDLSVILSAGVDSFNMNPNDDTQPGILFAKEIAAQYDYWQPPITAIVSDPDRGIYEKREIWNLPPLVTASGALQPSAIISSNLKYAHHIGDLVPSITCYTNDPNWDSISWEITRPGPNGNGDVIENLTGETIPYFFDLQGAYHFKCTVIANDGVTPGYGARTVEVYPLFGDPPPAAIAAPFSAEVGESVFFVSPSANETLYSYTWEFSDGTPTASGGSALHPFNNTGTFQVKLTVEDLSNSDNKSVVTHNITIVPVGVTPPSLGLTAPYAEEEDVNVNMNVVNPDTINWNYSWQFGDGTPIVNNPNASHAYADPGKYTITLTATSIQDPSSTFSITHIITIVPHGDPVPNLVITPGQGQSPLNVVLNATGSYATAQGASIDRYEINWGDNSGVQNVSGGNTANHQYTCSGGSACAYTVRVTVFDTYGGNSTISTVVTTWP
jgi:PKD repeat protein